MDSRGFTPWLINIEDIVNFILKSQRGKCIGKLWAY